MRKPKRRGLVPVDLAIDIGPSVTLGTDGRPRGWGGAVEIVIEDRPDPDRPDGRHVVRGARRRTALGDLFSRGVISKRQHDAAIRFLDDCSIASGGGGTAAMIGCGPVFPSPRAGLPERQVEAITRVRRIFHLLGLNTGTVFWWVVFQDGALSAYDGRWRLRNGTAAEWLKAALTALDEHYHGGGAHA